jgi:hypothetical protein
MPRQARKVHDVPDKPPARPFQAAIIDEWGQIASGVHTEPVPFAKALVAHWQGMPDKRLVGELLAYNADALDDLRRYHREAYTIASAIEVEPEPDTAWTDDSADAPADEVPYAPAVIIPFSENDRGWTAYVNELKAAAKTVPDNPEHATAWAQAQREVLNRAPRSTRLLAVNAIVQLLAKHGISGVAWLADLLKSKEDNDERIDERIVVGFERNIAGYLNLNPPSAALDDFTAYAKSTAVQAAMRRLQAQRPDLFTRADKAFGIAQAKLRQRVDEASE